MERFRSFGGIAESAIQAFEQRNGLSLPEDYRRFLRQQNGGLPDSLACFIKGPDQSVLIQALPGVDQDRDFDLQEWHDEYRDEMPPGFLIVALGSATFLILGTREDSRGVYCWDHAHVFAGSSEEDGNTFHIASSFTEFWNSLTPLK